MSDICELLFQFSQEEFEKRLRRRERNKVAAYKCRMKKKEAGEELKKVRRIGTVALERESW